jgi:hypothetical protein
MPRKRTSKTYTIQPFQIGPDQREIDLLVINFRADNLAPADLKKKPMREWIKEKSRAWLLERAADRGGLDGSRAGNHSVRVRLASLAVAVLHEMITATLKAPAFNGFCHVGVCL